ncbi:hypothetical protein JL193_16785 [Polaribacter batillariae]|uniref:DUF5723 domain-containing protein n=1 Tax=Polaribacter batillariae TaxID=2808900 RepID=A0ABX7SXY4_9FLAO|nr:hypothetical protein [Polaribacter batillariae]QTD37693.1 hypothetical protein JL193_16785 [Polaribacter batillariae]
MKKIVFLVSILSFISVFSQENTFTNLKVKELSNKIRLNYTLVHMPDELNIYSNYQLRPTMGFIGLNYNIPINDWLYTGAGFHAAFTGDQGGLFTLGLNLGINKKIYKNLYFDANIHFGGGGGYRVLVDGGGILYSNIGLQYKKNNYSFGVQYGNVNFFTGFIKNDNVSFFVEIPSTLRTASYADIQKKFVVNTKSKEEFWIKPAVKSVQQVTFDYFFPFGNSRTDSFQGNKPINNTLSILGFEYQRYLTSNTFIYAHVDAMYSGLIAGFMDLFFGVGKNLNLTNRINLFGKMGIGAAGGRIYQEGGLTMYPNIGADLRITEKFGLSVHGGYHRAIGGTFEAYTAGFSLKYYGLSGGIKDPFTGEEIKEIKTQGLRISAENQTYFDVAKFGIPDSDLQLIALKVQYDLNKRFYLAGEASFAYLGKSGGYAHGIFGLGINSNKFANNKLSLFAEAAAGVAGGGRIDSGEGVLIRPTAGINYHANDDLSFHVSGGQMWSPFGNVNSSNINVGLSYGFSLLNAKK